MDSSIDWGIPDESFYDQILPDDNSLCNTTYRSSIDDSISLRIPDEFSHDFQHELSNNNSFSHDNSVYDTTLDGPSSVFIDTVAELSTDHVRKDKVSSILGINRNHLLQYQHGLTHEEPWSVPKATVRIQTHEFFC